MLTDVHSHVLPGIDDGAADLGVSLAMLRRLAEQGVEDLILTPHFYSRRESLEQFVERRDRSLGLLVSADEITACTESESGPAAVYQAADTMTSIRLYLAGECSLSTAIFDYESIEPLVFGRGRYLLVEMPFTSSWDAHSYQQVDRLKGQFKTTPIIAHIERYPATRYGRDLEAIAKLVELGCLIQLNCDSLFDRETRRASLNLLKGEWIDILGSDSHNLSTRPPRFDECRTYVQKKLNIEIDEQFHLDLL